MSLNTPFLIPPQALEQPYCAVPPVPICFIATTDTWRGFAGSYQPARQDIPYQDTIFLALNKCPKYHLNAILKCQS